MRAAEGYHSAPMSNPLSRAVETLAPARLGRSFRWLFAATTITNVGDGVVLSAGPLLVASLTRDPFLVSLAVLMADLPMLLFALIGGVAADRYDRRRMVIVANLGRSLVLVVLVATMLAGTVSIAIVLAAVFVLGMAEIFADSASSTFIPNLVARGDLGIANSRMQGAFLLVNQLLLPPVGAFLFAVGPPIPFATNAICFLLGAVLVSRVVVSRREVRAESPVGPGRPRGGCPLAARPPADADARAHDLRLQRHLRGRRGPCSSCTPRTDSAWATWASGS